VRVTVIAEQLRRRVPGGIGTYVRGLAKGLREIDLRGVEVTLAASGRDRVAPLGFPVRTVPLPSPVLTRAWQRGVIGLSSDLVHATSLVAPWRGKGPRVVMVHDLGWRVVPEAYPPRGRRWHEAAFEQAQRKAALLVVPSTQTAEALLDAGVEPDRIAVIDEGCDHLPAPDEQAASLVLESLGVRGPFLLTVSTLEPRKNLAGLVAAYALTRPQLPEPWPLVVVGPNGWGPTVAPVSGVVLAGSVPDAVLAALYRRARCVAYVPLMEGFGLPAVEAMHAGTPVVASLLPSAGRAALVVDPLDHESVAAGLVTAATDERQRDAMIASGRARAAQLRWRDTAARHLAAWRRVAAR
jgi:glycosyltransferase involved in cell wall biosynthesis